MIIIVDGFDKSGRTTLAKKLGEEIGGSHIIDPIPYRRPDSLWGFKRKHYCCLVIAFG